jgi:hypothetical protein
MEQDFQKQIRAHGGTGFPPDLDPIEACHKGICLKCGGQWDALHTHAWKHYAGLSMADGIRAYREEFKIPEDISLDSDKHRETLRQAQLARMRGPNGKKIRADLAEKASGQHPEKYGKTGTKPSGKAIWNWPIAKSLARGKGDVQTAKQVGAANHKLVQRRAASLGLAFSTAFLCDHGEPFRYRSLYDLRRAVGCEADEFEKYAGLDERRSQATRPADSIVNPDEARKVIAWRDALIESLLAAKVLSLGGIKIGTDRVLKTLLPQLLETNRFLMLTIADLRKKVRDNPALTVAELGEWICHQAAIEKSSSATDERWRRTLRYLATERGEQFLQNNLDRLRGPEDDGEIVRSMIGYGASPVIIQNALRERTVVIEPTDMRALIHKYAQSSAEPKKKIGAPEGFRSDTARRIELAAAFSLCGWSQRKMAKYLYPDKPASSESNCYRFHSDYRTEVTSKKAKLKHSEAERLVNQALSKTPSFKS